MVSGRDFLQPLDEAAGEKRGELSVSDLLCRSGCCSALKRHLVYIIIRCLSQPHERAGIRLIGQREAAATLPRGCEAVVENSVGWIVNHRCRRRFERSISGHWIRNDRRERATIPGETVFTCLSVIAERRVTVIQSLLR